MTFVPAEFVRRLLELAASDDVAAISDMLDPEVVWFGTRGGLDESQVLRGPDAAIAYIREVQEPWEELDIEIEELIETADAVVVLTRERGRARHGGPEVQRDTAIIFKVRQERVVEMTGYLDRDEALRAAGIAQETSSG
jgi:ketosteroid isomerase-like protein